MKSDITSIFHDSIHHDSLNTCDTTPSSLPRSRSIVFGTRDGYTLEIEVEKMDCEDCEDSLMVKLTTKHKNSWMQIRYVTGTKMFAFATSENIIMDNVGSGVKVHFGQEPSKLQVLLETTLFFVFLKKVCNVKIIID